MNREQVYSEGYEHGTEETEEKYGRNGQFHKLGKTLGVMIAIVGLLLAFKIKFSDEKNFATKSVATAAEAPSVPEKVWSKVVMVDPGEESATFTNEVSGQWLCWGEPTKPLWVIANESEVFLDYPPDDPRNSEPVELSALYTLKLVGEKERAVVEVFRADRPCSDFYVQ